MFSAAHIDLFVMNVPTKVRFEVITACPGCKHPLSGTECGHSDAIFCAKCGLAFRDCKGVPQLFVGQPDAAHAWQREIYDEYEPVIESGKCLGKARDTTITYLRHSWHCRRLGIGENSLVLDVGCLHGQRVREIRDTFGCEVVGVDVSPKAIAAARTSKEEGASFHCASADALPFVDGAFTHLISFDVLEHLREPLRFVREARRVLRPGGVLFLHFPVSDFKFSFDWIWSLCQPEAFRRNQIGAGHDRRFMPSSYNIREMLAQEGFEVESAEWFNCFWQNIYDYHCRRYISEALFFSRYQISFVWYRKLFVLWPMLVRVMDFPWRWTGFGGSIYIRARKR